MSTENSIKLEQEGKIIFHSTTEHNATLVLANDGFYYMGERIDDTEDTHKRFNEWSKESRLNNVSTENSMKLEQKGKLIFYSTPDDNAPLVLTKDGCYYMGEKIDDIHDVYARFNDWLKKTTAK